MSIFHNMEQGTEQWEYARLGIPTSSNFDKILTSTGKPSKSAEKYAYFLLAERILNRKINTFTSAAMENGKIMEEDAANDYELQTGLDTKPIGFVTTDDGQIGCSPDRLVGDDGLLELKCPMPQTQMEYLITGKVDHEYYPQLQGQLFVTGRQWVDIMAFNPELPRAIVRVERNDSFIGALEAQLWDFVTLLNRLTDEILKRQPLPPGAKFAPKRDLLTEQLQF